MPIYEKNETSQNRISVSGWGLNGSYELVNFHFHFSSGSEHLIDGQGFLLDAHLVHKNQFGEATVLGFFFSVFIYFFKV